MRGVRRGSGFMGQGSYKWGYKSSPLIWVISVVTLLLTPYVTTHEPPSGASGHALRRVAAAV